MEQNQFDKIISRIDEKAAEIRQEILFQQKLIIIIANIQVALMGILIGLILS